VPSKSKGSASTYGRSHPGHGTPELYCSNVNERNVTPHEITAARWPSRAALSTCHLRTNTFDQSGFVLSPAGSFVINDTNPQFDRRLGPNTHVGIG